MYKRVLVIADGSDPGQPALRRALALLADGGELTIGSPVYEPMLEGYLGNQSVYEPLRARVIAERRAQMEQLARAVESRGIKTRVSVRWEHPQSKAIADEAREAQADLVVAAPAELHPGAGAKRGALSHRDWQLVMSCPAPLLVVKSDGQAAYRNVVAAVDPFHAYAKPASLDVDILRHAKALQARTGATLTALHCYVPIEYFGADLTYLPAGGAEFVDGREEALRKLCAQAEVPAAASRLVAGSPHTVLLGMQDRGEADLIVMGAIARGRLSELLLGSTAERVLHDGRVDVLVIKEPATGSD
jgi:universal stress protein E